MFLDSDIVVSAKYVLQGRYSSAVDCDALLQTVRMGWDEMGSWLQVDDGSASLQQMQYLLNFTLTAVKQKQMRIAKQSKIIAVYNVLSSPTNRITNINQIISESHLVKFSYLNPQVITHFHQLISIFVYSALTATLCLALYRLKYQP